MERNQVSSIPELREKMKQIPSSVHEVLDDGGNLVYFSLVTSPIPHIRFSIVVSPDMAFSVAVNNVILPQKHFHELVPTQKTLYSTDVVSQRIHCPFAEKTGEMQQMLRAPCDRRQFANSQCGRN